MKLKTKKFLAREGLIFLVIVGFGVLFLGFAEIGRYLYVRYSPSAIELMKYGKVRSHIYFDLIESFAYIWLIFSYPFYWVVKFVLWAIKTLKEKEE